MFKGRSKASKLLRQLQLRQLSEVEEPEPVRQDYLSECHRTYSCIHCRAHLANHDELISKLFQGNHGRAYLFNKVLNVGCKQAVERELLTGLHAVADIYCDCCETTLGWKYEQAFVPSQKYKEGKYIIELVHMLKENNWDLTSYNSEALLEEQQQLDAELAVSSSSSSSGSTNNADAQCGRREQRPAGRVVEGLPVFGPSQGRPCVAGAAGAMTPPARASRRALLAKRANISSSSSYTTINLRPPVEGGNFSNLNSSGASSSGGASCSSGDSSGAEASASGSSSGSSSSENLDGQASGPAGLQRRPLEAAAAATARKATTTTTTTIGNDEDDDGQVDGRPTGASAVAGRAAAQPSAVQ